MDADIESIREALRRILEVERNHTYGAKTGSQSARRRDVEKVIDALLNEARSTKGP